VCQRDARMTHATANTSHTQISSPLISDSARQTREQPSHQRSYRSFQSPVRYEPMPQFLYRLPRYAATYIQVSRCIPQLRPIISHPPPSRQIPAVQTLLCHLAIDPQTQTNILANSPATISLADDVW
jgi:hypothetical protein